MFGPQHDVLHAASLIRFVAGLTGLHIAVLPAPASGRAWDLRRLIAGCRAHVKQAIGARSDSRCGSCALVHLRKALAAPRLGHHFEGPCGVRAFILPVTGLAGPVGVLTLRRGPESRRPCAPVTGTLDRRRDELFRQAVRLLRPLAREPVWSGADNGHEDGVACGSPSPCAGAAATAPRAGETRSRRVVQALMERMRRDYAEPLGLKKLAWESGLNASYLSTVFACEAGRPFKAYLTALRVEHAQGLLGDARVPILRVAREVGYATPRRFRAAFRAATGLSPSRWRSARLAERGR